MMCYTIRDLRATSRPHFHSVQCQLCVPAVALNCNATHATNKQKRNSSTQRLSCWSLPTYQDVLVKFSVQLSCTIQVLCRVGGQGARRDDTHGRGCDDLHQDGACRSRRTDHPMELSGNYLVLEKGKWVK